MSKLYDLDGKLDLPEIIEIEPTETCNLRCRMCHVSFMANERRTLFDVSLMDKLSSLRGRYAIVGSVFEPIIHPHIGRILEKLTEFDCQIEILTNGTLIDDEMVKVIASSNMYLISFSFDGIRRETFEYIRRHASHHKIVDNITRIREAFANRGTYFNLNYTMLRRNMDELIEATEHWDGLDFDTMNFIFMVVRELDPDVLKENLYPVRKAAFKTLDDTARYVITRRKRITLRSPHYRTSPLRTVYPENFQDVVVRSDNPDARIAPIPRQTKQLGWFPGMPFPCQSPYKLARILSNGDVQLCYKFVVGNLHEDSFEDIWYGQKADAVRQCLMRDDATCRTCDYYRLALKYNEMDLEDPKTFLSERLVQYADAVSFEQGVVNVKVTAGPPRLVETFGSYNIVCYDRKYLGVPQSAGPLDVDSNDVWSVPGLVIEDTLHRAKSKIKQLHRAKHRL